MELRRSERVKVVASIVASHGQRAGQLGVLTIDTRGAKLTQQSKSYWVHIIIVLS